jgi:hypothetical protein
VKSPFILTVLSLLTSYVLLNFNYKKIIKKTEKERGREGKREGAK